MNQEIKNKLYYQETFDEIHASEQLLRKMKNMKLEQSKKITRTIWKLGYAVAALVVVFISSNAITYAATGNTWVEKVYVTINGKRQEVDMTKSVDADGNESLTATFDVGDTESFEIRMDGDGNVNTSPSDDAGK